jgi:23S rRNA pseudouridine1911/1915/1917 synthase
MRYFSITSPSPQPSPVQGEGAVPLRLDLYLVQQNLNLSRSQIQKLADAGKIWVNEKPARVSYKVHPGDKIAIQIPPPKIISAQPESIPLKILYEDKHIAVVNKPAGLAVHAAPSYQGSTLVNALLFHLKDLSGIGGELRPGIVHRLDKGTSGLMLVAKSNEAHVELTRQFQDRLIEKTYWALAYGTFKNDSGSIENRLGRSRGNRKKFSSRTRKGREAKTFYRVLKRYDLITLLEVKPFTGRTHQIRVHLAESGHPVVGDPLYGGRQWVQKLSPSVQEEVSQLNHQALHAWKLKFKHPITKKEMEFEVEVPEDVKKIVKRLS